MRFMIRLQNWISGKSKGAIFRCKLILQVFTVFCKENRLETAPRLQFTVKFCKVKMILIVPVEPPNVNTKTPVNIDLQAFLILR